MLGFIDIFIEFAWSLNLIPTMPRTMHVQQMASKYGPPGPLFDPDQNFRYSFWPHAILRVAKIIFCAHALYSTYVTSRSITFEKELFAR